MSDFDPAWPILEGFHRSNGTEVIYHPPATLERSRAGRAVATTIPKDKTLRVLMDWSPTPEQITAFGDPSKFQPGQKAIFRVLAADLKPDQAGEFEWNGIRYSILASTPLVRGGKIFKYDVLVGYE